MARQSPRTKPKSNARQWLTRIDFWRQEHACKSWTRDAEADAASGSNVLFSICGEVNGSIYMTNSSKSEEEATEQIQKKQ